jgi:hypothetical protein
VQDNSVTGASPPAGGYNIVPQPQKLLAPPPSTESTSSVDIKVKHPAINARFSKVVLKLL